MPTSETSSVVVDASVLVDLVLRPRSLSAEIDQAWLHAPSHVDVEVLSALRGLILGGQVTPTQAVQAVGDIEQLGVRLWSTEPAGRRRVLELAHNFSAYDAGYVVLAEALDLPFATRDRRLAAAADRLVEVRLL